MWKNNGKVLSFLVDKILDVNNRNIRYYGAFEIIIYIFSHKARGWLLELATTEYEE